MTILLIFLMTLTLTITLCMIPTARIALTHLLVIAIGALINLATVVDKWLDEHFGRRRP